MNHPSKHTGTILTLLALAVLALASVSMAAPAPYVWLGQYVETKISAPSIQGSILPVPTETTLAVYLPPSYATSGKSYPVIYFLHGAEEDAKTWGKPLSRVLDTMYSKGFDKEFIMAFPTGRNSLGSSFYTNSPAIGNWEDHITKDAVGYMDRTYRTIAAPGGRAIVGFSMGGYGAIAIGMTSPKVFSCAYGMSPGVLEENKLERFQPLYPDAAIPFLKAMAKNSAVWEGTVEQAKTTKWKAGMDSFALAYGLAFAPAVEKGAPYMEFPYSLVDGKLVRNEAAWKKWYDGYAGWEWKVETYRENLLGLRLFAFDAGKQDFYSWIPQGCKWLDGLLTSKGIPHYYGSYNGNHGDKLAQRLEEAVIPELAKVMDAAR